MSISERKKEKYSAHWSMNTSKLPSLSAARPLRASPVSDAAAPTIRNELAELTALGYLEQPHTSAGRIPTPAGYRMYVNEAYGKAEAFP